MIRDTFRMRKQNLPCIFLLCKYPVIFIVAGRAGGRARWIYPRGIAADTVEKGKEREDGRVGYVAAETKRQKSRRYLGLTAFTELLKISSVEMTDEKKEKRIFQSRIRTLVFLCSAQRASKD